MKVRAGLGIYGWPFPRNEASHLWDFIDMAESSDVDSVWVSDRILSSTLSLHSMSILAALAGRTRRMKFGNSVLALPLYQPILLAKQIATIDFISGGRILPAVGLGSDNRVEYEASGVSMKERAARADEAIVLMRKLWTEESVTFHGRYFHVTDIHLEPRTATKPCPPIWIGGSSDAAHRRNGRLGDGWLASSVTPAEVQSGIAAIQKYAREANRSVPDDHFGVILTFRFGINQTKAFQGASAYLRQRLGARAEDYGAFGTPDEIVTTVEK